VSGGHRHHWRATGSVTGVGAPGFSERWHRRFEKITGFRLPHPGYVLADCRCGAKAVRDYCQNNFPKPEPWHPISDEAYEKLSP